MTQTELEKILRLHKMWGNNEDGGIRADLSDTNLSDSDLSDADLSDAYLSGANLRDSYLRGADLRGADLRGADLRGADLDYSCFPLWCGGLHIKVDKRIACQLAYHLCSLDCEDAEFITMRNSILDFANQFHRADECGLLQANEPAPSANGTSSEE